MKVFVCLHHVSVILDHVPHGLDAAQLPQAVLLVMFQGGWPAVSTFGGHWND